MFLVYCFLFVWSVQNFASAECPKIITYKEWDGQPPKHNQYLPIPLDLVIVQHTVSEACSDDVSCAEAVRSLQNIHKDKIGLWDIGPSFLIGGTGKVYEGRGWFHVAIHTPGYNNQSYSIAFIGSFNNANPSEKAVESAKSLIQCGVEQNYLTSNYTVVAQSQLVNTESPGKKLIYQVKSWTNWLADVSEIKKRIETITEPTPPGTSPQSRLVNDDNAVILRTSEDIDGLTHFRKVIAELIENLSKLSIQTLDTGIALKRGLDEQVELFFKSFLASMKALRDSFAAIVSSVPAINKATRKCLDETKQKGEAQFSATEKAVHTCADTRIEEISAMITNLNDIGNNARNVAIDTKDNTGNCTELNLEILKPTRTCLESVTGKTRSANEAFESQRNLVLNSIKTSLKNLPAALELCSKKPLLDATTNSNKIAADAASCSSKGLFGGFL